MRFVKVPKQVVDEMRERFGNGHGSLRVRASFGRRAGGSDPPMVQ
jgi:hypothetical protein